MMIDLNEVRSSGVHGDELVHELQSGDGDSVLLDSVARPVEVGEELVRGNSECATEFRDDVAVQLGPAPGFDVFEHGMADAGCLGERGGAFVASLFAQANDRQRDFGLVHPAMIAEKRANSLSNTWKVGVRMNDEWPTERWLKVEARVRAVLDLHQPVDLPGSTQCNACAQMWPCPTARVMVGEGSRI